MRGLVAGVVVLLVSCGGGGDGDIGDGATTTIAPSTATMAATASSPSATGAAVVQAASPIATRVAAPTQGPTPSPAVTQVVPTPIVMGSPAADLPAVGQLTATVPVGVKPLAVAVGLGAIWVQNDIDGTLSRIDPATNVIVATIQIATPLDPANAPSDLLGLRQAYPDLAIDADSVWAIKPEEQAIVRVDPRTNTVIATIALEAKAASIAVDGSSVWVSLFGTSSVARIDTATGEVVATIRDVPTPGGIAVYQDAVWVTNVLSNTITRIDPATNQVVASVSVAWSGAPFVDPVCGLCVYEVLADEHGVWATLRFPNYIVRINPATNRLAAAIPVGISPRSLASDPRGVWVGHESSAGVLLIDRATNQVIAAVPATEAPHQLAWMALAEDTLWAARSPTNDVVRVDLQLE